MSVRPVFVGGAPGSGSTLLVDVLGSHRAVSPIYETEFVVHLARLLAGPGTLRETAERVWRIVDTWSEALPMPRHRRPDPSAYLHGAHYVLFDRPFVLTATEALVRSLAVDRVAGFRQFVTTLFQAHTALDGKGTWINESPGLATALPFFQRAFPDLLFVHVLRDGREVAARAVTRPHGPRSWSEAAHVWRGVVSSARAFAAHHPGSMLEVRLEELLDDPVGVLEPVLRAMDTFGAGDCIQRWHQGGGTLRAERPAYFRADPADVAAFDAVAGEWLTRTGYRTGVQANTPGLVAVGA
jgi:hypothetical protein